MEYYSVHQPDSPRNHHPHHGPDSWDDERPPTYNPEDYAAHLTRFNNFIKKKWCYEHYSRFTDANGGSGGDSGSGDPITDVFSYEMGLRQFRNVSDLMTKLMYDLQVSYDSFVQEFIRFPNNGVTRLCDLLKVIQLSQTNHKSASHSSIRTVQSDEFQTLLCLKVRIWFNPQIGNFTAIITFQMFLYQLCAESEEGAMKILDHSTGLFTVAVCVMSNFSKSRVLALQLLTRLCTLPGN